VIMIPIRLENLTKQFGRADEKIIAVDDVSLAVSAGELFFLLGPSGCGKTTLLRMIAGFVKPDKGKIFFANKDITNIPPEKRSAAMVFQNYALWPHMTVEDNIGFAASARGIKGKEKERIVRQLLQTVRIVEKASAKPLELSGGQQQRVALARALASKPNCLLLDEPMSNLDASLRAEMREEIRRIIKAAGTTTIYVTHDQTEAMAIADRIAIMHEGKIVQVGTAMELYQRPANRFVAKFLGEANFIDATVKNIQGQIITLETPFGNLLTSANLQVKIGDKVICCIRPEMLQITSADEKTETNTFPATITEWQYLGELVKFHLRLMNGTELIGTVMPARSMENIAQQVRVYIPMEGVIVLTQ
ncbi:MAG: ABC transporter ATP-binding protein, partial [Planctomycetes bacterium]|nr:ABC transporter ATP-binding protein [Planctomycetota bacterium]